MSATTVDLSNRVLLGIYRYFLIFFFLCRDRQCGARSHPAGANPSGGSEEDGGLQGKTKTASEEGQVPREHASLPQGVNPAPVMCCSRPLSPAMPQPPPCPWCLPLPGSPELLPTCCNHVGELRGNPQLPSSHCYIFSFGHLLGPAIAGAQLQGLQPRPGMFSKHTYSAV